MRDAKSYWDGKYEKFPHKTGKSPNKFLASMLPRLQKGLTLDIAMGEGKNAVFLAEHGFEVKGFDISPVAIKHAQNLAESAGVQIEAKTCDLDMYLMGVLKYDTVIMTRFKPTVPRYYSSIISALKQGGVLLIDSYGIPQMKEVHGKEDHYKNIFFGSNEILHQIKDLKILFYQEGEVDGKYVVQCLAQKPIDRHAAKYDTFGMHTKGAQIKKDSAQHHLELAEQLFNKN